MPRLADLMTVLEQLAPLSLAADWDNVGLLLGDRDADISRVLTCLTLTPPVAEEARQDNRQLIIAHHPILFRAVKRLTADNPEGRMLLSLAQAGIAVYSPHTAYDNSAAGINQQLAELLELTEVRPLQPQADGAGTVENSSVGVGRTGVLSQPVSLVGFARLVEQRLKTLVQYVGPATQPVQRVGILCGSGGELLTEAIRQGCDVFLTGEARFHSCLEAESRGIGLVLAGHYATERPGMERMAEVLKSHFPDIDFQASQMEADPLQNASQM